MHRVISRTLALFVIFAFAAGALAAGERAARECEDREECEGPRYQAMHCACSLEALNSLVPT